MNTFYDSIQYLEKGTRHTRVSQISLPTEQSSSSGGPPSWRRPLASLTRDGCGRTGLVPFGCVDSAMDNTGSSHYRLGRWGKCEVDGAGISSEIMELQEADRWREEEWWMSTSRSGVLGFDRSSIWTEASRPDLVMVVRRMGSPCWDLLAGGVCAWILQAGWCSLCCVLLGLGGGEELVTMEGRTLLTWAKGCGLTGLTSGLWVWIWLKGSFWAIAAFLLQFFIFTSSVCFCFQISFRGFGWRSRIQRWADGDDVRSDWNRSNVIFAICLVSFASVLSQVIVPVVASLRSDEDPWLGRAAVWLWRCFGGGWLGISSVAAGSLQGRWAARDALRRRHIGPGVWAWVLSLGPLRAFLCLSLCYFIFVNSVWLSVAIIHHSMVDVGLCPTRCFSWVLFYCFSVDLDTGGLRPGKCTQRAMFALLRWRVPCFGKWSLPPSGMLKFEVTGNFQWHDNRKADKHRGVWLCMSIIFPVGRQNCKANGVAYNALFANWCSLVCLEFVVLWCSCIMGFRLDVPPLYFGVCLMVMA